MRELDEGIEYLLNTNKPEHIIDNVIKHLFLSNIIECQFGDDSPILSIIRDQLEEIYDIPDY